MTSRFLHRRGALALALAATALSLAAPAALAQNAWPSKPVRIVVAYPAGGVSDVVARAIADKLAAALGVAVVVENRAGASGTIGVDVVAKAAPDGYTFGFSAISPLTLNPHLGRSPFDPLKDLTPVVSVMYSPVLLLGTSATDAKDFKSLIETARARPGAIRWATSGQASLGHIMLEQVKSQANVQITHVPYKGGGQQLTDAISGQFEVLSTNAGPTVAPQIKAGKLRPLAVGAPTRLESMKDVPTLGELGYTAANLSSQFGMIAPAGTPAPIVERINAEVNRALASPDLRARLVATDNVPTGGKPSDFARDIAFEYESDGRIIRASGIKAE